MKHHLTRTTRSVLGMQRPGVASTVYFHLNLADAWERAEHCVDIAEQRVRNISVKIASTGGVISAVIQAVDQLKDIVDTIAEVNPDSSTFGVKLPE